MDGRVRNIDSLHESNRDDNYSGPYDRNWLLDHPDLLSDEFSLDNQYRAYSDAVAEQQIRLRWRQRIMTRAIRDNKIDWTPAQKTVFFAVAQGETMTDIAKELGITQQMVSKHMKYAVKKIQKCLNLGAK